MHLRFGQYLSLIALCAALAACVSVDPRIAGESIDRDATRNLTGDFSNRASYWSGTFPARDNLADLFGVPAQHADTVRITREPTGALILRWLSDDKELASRVFPQEETGLAADGAIEIRTKGSWENVGNFRQHEQWTRRLFINQRGDLAVTVSYREAGAGFLVIVPIALASYTEQLAVFPRK